MKALNKLQTLPEGVTFLEDLSGITPKTVQGGSLYAKDKTSFFVESGGRYKLFSEQVDYVKIIEGSGHFKWARGETPLCAGDIFRLEKVGEYEINGKCRFAVIRK